MILIQILHYGFRYAIEETQSRTPSLGVLDDLEAAYRLNLTSIF